MEELIKEISISERISTALIIEFIQDHQNINKTDLEEGFADFIESYEKVKSLILLNKEVN